jgi:hypothetical protein
MIRRLSSVCRLGDISSVVDYFFHFSSRCKILALQMSRHVGCFLVDICPVYCSRRCFCAQVTVVYPNPNPCNFSHILAVAIGRSHHWSSIQFSLLHRTLLIVHHHPSIMAHTRTFICFGHSFDWHHYAPLDAHIPLFKLVMHRFRRFINYHNNSFASESRLCLMRCRSAGSGQKVTDVKPKFHG